MRRAKILLVDDDQVIRDVFHEVLGQEGFDVREASNYDQAIGLMDASIDIALLDIVLQGQSGMDILSYIHRLYPLCPVIMVSGHANKNNAIDALRKGATDYLEKPVDMHELLHVVRRCLSYRTLKGENIKLRTEHQFRRELRESGLHYQNLIEAAPDAIVSVDQNYRIIVFNSGAERTFGYSREEVLGQELDMLLTEDLREIHRRHRAEFVASDKTVKLANMRPEITGLRKNGEVFPATGSIAKSISNGKTIVTAIVHDISERKQVEKALQEQMQNMERFNRMAVGRELRMIELKKEINKLLAELDRGQKYTIHSIVDGGYSEAGQ